MTRGRFAPSPTGDLHLGNLATAVVAWCSSRHAGGDFIVRMEDLDPMTSRREHENSQLRDLTSLGLTYDPHVIRQSERFAIYRDAINELEQRDLTYPCYCTRKEIALAAQAPHGVQRAYPGTCRHLTERQRRQHIDAGRPSAIRFRSSLSMVTFADRLSGTVSFPADDVVLLRNDQSPAYHLAVVIDDDLQGVTEVVRGDDLLPSTASQIELGAALNLRPQTYGHIPLVLNEHGQRLAKRDGAVTLTEQFDAGASAAELVNRITVAYGLGTCTRPSEVAARFSWDRITREPVQISQLLTPRR